MTIYSFSQCLHLSLFACSYSISLDEKGLTFLDQCYCDVELFLHYAYDTSLKDCLDYLDEFFSVDPQFFLPVIETNLMFDGL